MVLRKLVVAPHLHSALSHEMDEVKVGFWRNGTCRGAASGSTPESIPFPTGMKFRLVFEQMELLRELPVPQDTHTAPSAMLAALAVAKWFILG